jgi:hypothetical protein
VRCDMRFALWSTLLVAGAVATLLLSEHYSVVPAAWFGYARAQTVWLRWWWWTWPALWAAYGVAFAVAWRGRPSAPRVASYLGKILAFSLVIRGAALWPVVHWLDSIGAPLPSVNGPRGPGLDARWLLLSPPGQVTSGVIALALLAGLLAVSGTWLAARLVQRAGVLLATGATLICTVALQFAAALGSGVAIGGIGLVVPALIVLCPTRHQAPQDGT